jgi:opacity protein-like surface antigen
VLTTDQARQERQMKPTKPASKLLVAVLLLIATASYAAAQSYLTHAGCYGLKGRGYYGTPYDGGPQFGSGGGDQYGYGPAYSYARQAPSCIDLGTSRVGTRRSKTAHGK